jgi:hypothetical protein
VQEHHAIQRARLQVLHDGRMDLLFWSSADHGSSGLPLLPKAL